MNSKNNITAETKKLDVFHERANHEDNLHLSRTDLLISFNGFLAIAVGLVEDNEVKIIFALMVLIVDITWALWAQDASKFIRSLRDAGEERADEKIWKNTVGPSETKNRCLKDPLTIVSTYMPCLLIVGWCAILIYYMCK